MAITVLASCVKEQPIAVDRQLIAFGNAFVDNATKADYSSGKSLEEFNVWGTVTGNGNTLPLYSGATVTGKIGDAVWACDQKEYWVPSCSYTFMAIADATNVTGMPSKVGYSVESKGDLLLATATATTDENGTPSGTYLNGNRVVEFTFTHLLSKVFFKFSYGVANNTRYAFAVKSISLSGLTAQGEYTIGSNNWAAVSSTPTTSLSFAVPTTNVSNVATPNSADSHQILPLKQTITATITYDVIYDSKTILANQTQSATLTDQVFAGNTVYCLNVAIPAPGEPIQFRAQSIGAFGDGGNLQLQ